MNFLYSLRRYRWYLIGRFKIKRQIKKSASDGKLKIILGAGSTTYEGWISTDIPHFDILKKEDWHYFFANAPIDNLLIEHVLEHLTQEEVTCVVRLMYKYLKRGGCLRIAVPDGYHPDPSYIQLIAPPSDGHKSVWNINTLQHLLNATGFQTNALEYYTEGGVFSGSDFDFLNGTIIRSKMKGYKSTNHADYSSLIIDAYKMK